MLVICSCRWTAPPPPVLICHKVAPTLCVKTWMMMMLESLLAFKLHNKLAIALLQCELESNVVVHYRASAHECGHQPITSGLSNKTDTAADCVID